jgi:hypothetical protein
MYDRKELLAIACKYYDRTKQDVGKYPEDFSFAAFVIFMLLFMFFLVVFFLFKPSFI